jgi:hypothetical protein
MAEQKLNKKCEVVEQNNAGGSSKKMQDACRAEVKQNVQDERAKCKMALQLL